MIIYNPHVDDFLAEPLQFRLLKRRALKKYGFLFNEARSNGTEVRVLIDGTASGLIPEALFQFFPRWIRIILSNIEFMLWKHINGFGSEVTRVDIPQVQVEEVLLAFSYKAATGRFSLRKTTFLRYSKVIFHLSHYFLATSEKATNIRTLPNAYLAGDSDITEIAYFQSYFNWYKKPFLVLPFSVGSRFSNIQPWLARNPKAVATGSFHDLSQEQPARKYYDFINATGSTTYHPVRLALYQASNRLADWVHCKVSPYRDYGRSKLSKLVAHFNVAQRQYFSINIVELYNQHRYAVVGEELSGFPALGALEAMACGCVLIAQPQYYVGLGFEPGDHYLPYDGSIDQLTKLLSANANTDLSSLAARSANDIKMRFSSHVVYARWKETLLETF